MTTRIAISLAGMLLLGALGAGQAADDPSPEPPADVTWTTELGSCTATVKSGPGGPTIRLTTATVSGGGSLRFKDGTTPARFTIRIMNKRNYAQSFTLSDGTYTLRGTSPTGAGKSVTYWDRGGREVDLARAAVTLSLETTKDGHIDIHVRCARGVELGKQISVNWSRILNRKMLKD
jgi:hypothetical protein